MKNRTLCFLILTIFILLPTSQLFAQQVDRPLQPLSDEDFNCFQTVECLLSNDELKSKGWHFTMDDSVTDHPQELIFNMKGANVFLNAVYTKEGNLKRAKYQLFNRAVPSAVMNIVAEGDFKDWKIVANRLTVRNFNSATADFVLTLENGSSSETLKFNLSEFGTDKSALLAID